MSTNIAAFAGRTLWATAFIGDELNAAGAITVIHARQGGLAEMTAENRNIDDCDLVMRHTVALPHAPRPEDWPAMRFNIGFSFNPSWILQRKSKARSTEKLQRLVR